MKMTQPQVLKSLNNKMEDTPDLMAKIKIGKQIEDYKAENYKQALSEWLKKANKITSNELTVSVGRKYDRIISGENNWDRCAFCFINRSNGDVLKSASWSKPARHARGNIYTNKLGVGQFGAHYL